MLLLPFHALGGYKVHFRFAVVAVEQSRKKACPASFRRSALVFPKLLHPQPMFLGDDGFLHIGYDLVIFLVVLDFLMDFVTDGSAFEIDGAAGVLTVFKDIANGRSFLPARVFGDFLYMFPADGFKIGGEGGYLFFLKLSCNLHRAFSSKAQGKNLPYGLCRWLVNNPLFRVIFRFFVPIWYDRSDTLAVFRFGLSHRTDFLRGLRGIPFVENIVEGHHLHAVAGQSVHTLLYGDKADTQRWIHYLRKPAHFHLFKLEA